MMVRWFIVAALVAAASPALATGEALYQQHCSLCHGDNGQGGEGFRTPIWGSNTQITKFNTAQGLFEYMQLLMPFDDPAKIDDAAKWQIVTYILERHGTLTPNQGILGPQTASAVAIR